LALVLIPIVLGLVGVYSGVASRITARLVADYVREISYRVEPGPAPAPARSTGGPFDIRLGYHELPATLERLEARGFTIAAQARVSDRFNRVAALGLFPPYREKTQAGLELRGDQGTVLSRSRYPQHIYDSFPAIPDPVRETLLFLENRELLDDRDPYRNPAIEWDRLVAAVVNFAGGKLLGAGGRFGASTLATQLEKLRHSPNGITRTPGDKARQMASATLRSYAGGPRTAEVRRTILTNYLNALPVGAMPGYGEVIGLRDGLRVWFGLDPNRADSVLFAATRGPVTGQAALAYRSVVMLLIAQRRPSHYLQTPAGREALVDLTDSHLRLIGSSGAVSRALTEAALGVNAPVQTSPPPLPPRSFVERKAINATRSHLMGLTGVPGLYELDRRDLTAHLTIDGEAQTGVTALIQQMVDPNLVREAGLDTPRQLGGADLSQVAYGFVLYERTPAGNAIRVQADNLERPFDLNSGARLELGSTAKLRTLVTYLELVDALHAELTSPVPQDSTTPARIAQDPITRWAREFLAANPGADATTMLEAAMQRRYSASPAETFFTGGGAHVFSNFDNTHDRDAPTVLEGFRHSVNLVYVRLMRDIVRYHEHRLPGYGTGLLEDPTHPARRVFLEQFADAEGRELIARYYRRHRVLPRDSSLTLLAGSRATPTRWARLELAISPSLPVDTLAERVAARFGPEALTATELARIRRGFPETLNLADRAFLTRVHPLELWVVSQLQTAPGASLSALQEAGAGARQEAYAWLFRNTPAVRRAQDRSLRIILEREAFRPIRTSWQRLGYPYGDMVASLGTSIGSSGDRPGALAELVGILLADGVRRPVVRVSALHFGAGTPYETLVRHVPVPGEQVLSPAVAAVARMALADVVQSGTASLLRGAVQGPEGAPMVIGGKTGTGQNEVKTFGPGGRLLSTRATSRTATFVFFIGDRFFGVATAYVEGPDAEQFRFTSGLPVRVVRLLLPRLEGLLTAPGS
jgi:membrane peptidoglycan carboxypeptidase